MEGWDGRGSGEDLYHLQCVLGVSVHIVMGDEGCLVP